MYLVGCLHFPTLERRSFVEDILCIPAVRFSLITGAICPRGSPFEGCMVPSVVMGWLCGWSGRRSWPLVWLVARPYLMWMLLATDWWEWVTGDWLQNTRGAPRLVLGYWWAESKSRRPQGMLPAHWWVKPGPGTSVSLLAGRAVSWGLIAHQGCQSRCWITGGWGQFLRQLAVGSEVSWSLCWPASGWGQVPAGSRAGSHLLVGRLNP